MDRPGKTNSAVLMLARCSVLLPRLSYAGRFDPVTNRDCKEAQTLELFLPKRISATA